jgi:hypothetical protein
VKSIGPAPAKHLLSLIQVERTRFDATGLNSESPRQS